MAMTFSDITTALPTKAVTTIDQLPYPRVASGKVREIFDLGDALLLGRSCRIARGLRLPLGCVEQFDHRRHGRAEDSADERALRAERLGRERL